MNNIQEFKQAYDRFIKALRYIVENEQKLKVDPKRWEKIKKNFFERFEAPMDLAWQNLSKEERKRLAPLYLHRRVQSDPTVQKVIKTFNARITNMEEVNGTNLP